MKSIPWKEAQTDHHAEIARTDLDLIRDEFYAAQSRGHTDLDSVRYAIAVGHRRHCEQCYDEALSKGS